jgi:membrane protein
MSILKKIITLLKLLFNKVRLLLIAFFDKIYPPGFQGASLYEILVIFIEYVGKPRFNLYAGALSFNFFLALFPALLFIFTLVAYIPIQNLQQNIIQMMEMFLPDATFQTINTTVSDIITKQRGGLLSFGFISALYFASNGFYNMMTAFDSSLESDIIKKRNFLKKRFISIFITLLVTVLLLATLMVLFVSGYLHRLILDLGANVKIMDSLRKTTELLTLSSLVFFIISFIYYYAPSHVKKWKIFTPGSIVATFFSLLATYLFTTYVNQFNTYNKIYGSIGAIVALMLLIYVNIYAILIGFELNHSINKASIEKLRTQKKMNTFKNML